MQRIANIEFNNEKYSKKEYFSHRMIWGNEDTGTSLYVYES